ncbi:hypothetical protein GCM10022258_44470 [Aquimarina gracilis]
MAMGISDIDTDYNNYKHHTDSYALRYNYERNFKKTFQKELLDDFETNLVLQMSNFDPVKEIRGARNLIQFFKDRQVSFCFATGALPRPAILKLEQCDIWFDKKILATSKTHESREGFVLDAIERSKAFYNKEQFDNIVSVGDGIWDLKTAQNLSIDFVGIGDRNRSKLEANGAQNCFSDLKEFKEALF